MVEKQGKTDLDVGLSFANRNDVCVYLQEGKWCSVTSGHWWFVLRLGDNSNINTGNPLKTPKKTGIYRQTVCVYSTLSSNRHWWTQLGSCCHYRVTAGKPVILYLYIALLKQQSQNFLICEITLLLWWSCTKIRWFFVPLNKIKLRATEYLNVCEQLNLNVFESYLNSVVDDTKWNQIWIFSQSG